MGLGKLSAAIVAVAMTLGGCSGSDRFAENTIAVLGDTGDLVLVDVATGDVTAVPDGDGDARGFPAWSPDGSKLAFTSTAGTASALGVFDGDTVTSIPTAFPSFYNYWDPSSEVIGYLGDYQGSVGFGVANTRGGTATVIDSSQPYFFSWADDGSRVVSHSELELRVVDRAGELGVELNVSPAFQAPVWLAGGEEVLVALPATNGARLGARRGVRRGARVLPR